MKILAKSVAESIDKGSWIRRMFEAGIALKAEHGEEAVCDFSLGNPDLPPPAAVGRALRQFADTTSQPFSLGYMPNGGFPWARDLLAKHLAKEQGVKLSGNDVILTCGAAGGLNALFKAILDPADEVLAPAPYFVEYGAYAANHGGVFRSVPTKPDFSLDLAAIESAINPKTRAIIINSPNNPTGKIYSKHELEMLCSILAKKSEGRDRPIFLVSDEPYRFLAYDQAKVPALLPMYPYTIVAGSFSKNLSMPGERIGYLALCPEMKDKEQLAAGLILANRVLGFVNPPVIGQHLMAAALETSVDARIYERRRDAMAKVLKDAGYEFNMPGGAFYFFPKAPGGDDVAFTNKLMKYLILAVPGSGFGGPGYFRLAFCVDESIIYRAADGFKKALQ